MKLNMKSSIVGSLLMGALLVLPSLGGSLLLADIFKLKDGRTVEGTVIGEFGSLVSVKKEDGSVITFDKDDVTAQEVTRTRIDEYLEKKADTAKEDIEANLKLAGWCIEGELLREALFHFKRVLKIDASHAEARKALGYEKVGADWYFSGPEAEAAKNRKPGSEVEAPMKELPTDVDLEELTRVPPPRKRDTDKGKSVGAQPVVGDSMSLVLKETLMKKKAERSPTHFLLDKYLRTMKRPMSVIPGSGGEFTCEVTIDVRFVRTHYFYDKLPLSNIFEGKYKVKVKNQEGKELAVFRAKVPFSASTKTPKDKAVNFAHYYTVQRILDKVSRHSFFRGRGAPARSGED